MAKFRRLEDVTQEANRMEYEGKVFDRGDVYPTTESNPYLQPLGKYDRNLPAHATPEEQLAYRVQNQTTPQALGNGLVQAAAELGLGTAEGIGYLLDFQQHANLIAGTEKEFGNWFSDIMKGASEQVAQNFPIYGGEEVFNPLSGKWWAQNLPVLATSLSLMVPAAGAVKGLGALGKLTRGRALINTLAKGNKAIAASASLALQGIEGAMASRYMESIMEASESMQSKIQEYQNQGYSLEKATEKAGDIAASVFYTNQLALLTDIPQYLMLFKGLDAFKTMAKASGGKGKFLKELAAQIVSEGGEEAFQYGVQQSAASGGNGMQRIGKTLANMANDFPEYFEDKDFWKSVVGGALGGAVFHTAGHLINNKVNKVNEQYANIKQLIAQGREAEAKAELAKVAVEAADDPTANEMAEFASPEERSFFQRIKDRLFGERTTRSEDKLGEEKAKDIVIAEAQADAAMESRKQAEELAAKEQGQNVITEEGAENKKGLFFNTRKKELDKLRKKYKDDPDAQKVLNDLEKEYSNLNEPGPRSLNDSLNKAAIENSLKQEVNLFFKSRHTARKVNKASTPAGEETYVADKAKEQADKDKQQVDNLMKDPSVTPQQMVSAAEHVTTPEQQARLAEHFQNKIDEEFANLSVPDDENISYEDWAADVARQNPFINYASNLDNKTVSDLSKRLAKVWTDNKGEKPEVKVGDPVKTESTPAEVVATSETTATVQKENGEQEIVAKEVLDTHNTPPVDIPEEAKPIPLQGTQQDITPQEFSPAKTNTSREGIPIILTRDILHKKENGRYVPQFEDAFPQEDPYLADKFTSNFAPLDEQIDFIRSFDPTTNPEVYFVLDRTQSWNAGNKVNMGNAVIHAVVYRDGKMYSLGIVKALSRESLPKDQLDAIAAIREELWNKQGSLVRSNNYVRIQHILPGTFNYTKNRYEINDLQKLASSAPVGYLPNNTIYLGISNLAGDILTNLPTDVAQNVVPSAGTPGMSYMLVKGPDGRFYWSRLFVHDVEEVPGALERIEELLATANTPEWKDKWKEVRTAIQSYVTWIVQDKEGNVKYEPDFRENLPQIARFQTDGVFDPKKFMDHLKLNKRPIQVNADMINTPGYNETILHRVYTNLDMKHAFHTPAFILMPYQAKKETVQAVPASTPAPAPLNVEKFIITKREGKYYYDSGNEVTDETTLNKIAVKENYNSKRKVSYNNSSYYVLPDNRIISLNPTSKGKEVYKTGPQREKILEQVGGNIVATPETRTIQNLHSFVHGQRIEQPELFIDTIKNTAAYRDVEETYGKDIARYYELWMETAMTFPLADDTSPSEWATEVTARVTELYSKELGERFDKAADLLRKLNSQVNTELRQLIDFIEDTIYYSNLSEDLSAEEELKKEIPPPDSSKKDGGKRRGTGGFKPRVATVVDYEKLDVAKAVKWLQSKLPSDIGIEVVEGLIRLHGTNAWGVTSNALVTLSNVAAKGTEYHEALHIVFGNLLTASEQKRVQSEAERIYGTENWEEAMAEDFREYMQTRKSVPSRIRRFFNRILQWLNLAPKRYEIDRLFRNIRRGNFANSPVVSTIHGDKFRRVGALSATQVRSAVSTIIHLFEVVKDYIGENAYSSALTADIDTNLILSTSASYSVMQELKYHYIDHAAEMSEQAKANFWEVVKGLRPDVADIDIENEVFIFNDQTPSPGSMYIEVLKGLSERGFKVSLKDNTVFEGTSQIGDIELEDNEAVEQREWWALAEVSVSPKEKLTPRLRRWLANIPTGDGDSLGIGFDEFFSPNQIYPMLQREIGKATSVNNMKEKMASSDLPFIRRILEQIASSPNPDELFTQLFTHIAQKEHPEFKTVNIRSEWVEDSKKISWRLFDSNVSQLRKTIINDLYDQFDESNAAKAIQILDSKEHGLNNPDTKRSKAFPKHRLANAFKFVGFSIPESVITQMDDTKAYYVALKLRGGLKGRGEFGSRFRDFVDEIKSLYPQDYQDAHFSVEGKQVYEWINSSFFGRLLNRTREEFVNHFTRDSLYNLLPVIRNLQARNDTELPFDLAIADGVKYGQKKKGTAYDNFSERDFFVNMLAYYHNNSEKAKEGYFLLPILSDSPTLAAVKMPKNPNIESTPEAKGLLDDIVLVARFEWERMRKEKAGVKNYDNNLSKVWLFKFLEPYLKADQFDALAIKNEIRKQIGDNVFLMKEKLRELGVLDASGKGTDLWDSSISDVDRFLKEFAANHMLQHSQLILLSTLDPAFYKGKNIVENISDFYKRAKQVWSPGTFTNAEHPFVNSDGITWVPGWYTPNRKMRVRIMPDSSQNKSSDNYDKIASIVGEEAASAYKSVEVADGQSYIDVVSWKDREVGLERWDDLKEEAFQILMSGRNLHSADVKALRAARKKELQKLRSKSEKTAEEEERFRYLNRVQIPKNTTDMTYKPYVFTHLFLKNILVPFQKKDSEFIVSPIYGIEGTPLYNPFFKELLTDMGYNFNTMSYDFANRKYEVASFESAIKAGSLASFSENNAENIREVDFSDWRLQQETPEHHLESTSKFGTQIMKLITADMDMGANYSLPDGTSMTGDIIVAEYGKLLIEDIKRSYNELTGRIAGDTLQDTYNNLVNIVREEVINRGMGDQFLEALDQATDTQETNLPLWHPLHAYRIEALLNSMFKANVTTQKWSAGFSLVNTSVFGFEKKPQLVFEGNRLKAVQVYAPIMNSRLLAYTNDTGLIDEEGMKRIRADIDAGILPDYLHGICYRIPTENKYSMFNIEIIGFLPTDAGSIIMPEEVTTIAGLDFDIDKVYGFTYAGNKYRDIVNDIENRLNGGQSVATVLDDFFIDTFDEEITDDLTRLGYTMEFYKEMRAKADAHDAKVASDNRKIDLIRAILSSEQSTKISLNPGGFPRLKTNNADIEKKQGLTPIVDYLSPNTLSAIAYRMISGKALVGFAATFNAAHALWMNAKKEIVLKYGFVFDGADFDTLSKKYDGATPDIYQDANIHSYDVNSIKVGDTLKYGTESKSHDLVVEKVTRDKVTLKVIAGEATHTMSKIAFSEIFQKRSRTAPSYITRNIAECLAAFVDNGKDPQAEKFNMNLFTAEVGLSLLAAGVPLKTMQYFLAQPAIRRLSAMYFNNGADFAAKDMVKKEIEKYAGDIKAKTPVPNFTTKQLYDSLGEEATSQRDVMLAFGVYMLRAAEVGKLVRSTRISDRGAGPSQGDNMHKIFVYEQNFDNIYGATEFLTEDNYNNQLAKSGLYDANEFIVQSAKFPNLNTMPFDDLLTYIENIQGFPPNADQINDLYREMFTFIGSGFSFFKTDISFFNELPAKLEKAKEILSDNKFLSRLVTPEAGVINFRAVTGTDYSEEQEIREAWEDLLYDDTVIDGEYKASDLGKDLAKYAFRRNGFRFGMNTFAHLQPVSFYSQLSGPEGRLTDYMKAQLQLPDDSHMLRRFFRQYINNNFENLSFVPTVNWGKAEQSRNVPYVGFKENTPVIIVTEPKRPFAYNMAGDMIPVNYIKLRQGNKWYLFKHKGAGVYQRVKVDSPVSEIGSRYYQSYDSENSNEYLLDSTAFSDEYNRVETTRKTDSTFPDEDTLLDDACNQTT